MPSESAKIQHNNDEPGLCTTCNKPKRRQSGGSLTQWMFDSASCNCEFLAFASQQPGAEDSREKLCFDCGKPIDEGRQGSFTQWIFRAETCSCARPGGIAPQELPAPGSDSGFVEPVWDEALTAQLGLPGDRYRAIDLLGGGSAARVYRCWDAALKKSVAIKCLARTNFTPTEVMQFQTEAKTTSRLTHENIVRVLDFGANEKGQPYMVMDCLEGRTLASLVSEHGCLAPEFVLYFIGQICDGMAHAHEAGIFHRDLKSSNIIVAENHGRPVAKIIDFGIASIVHEESSVVFQGHTLAGTPNYMSPDQIRAEIFDARSDIYSLGCIMFEALTGTVPFQAHTAIETIAKHANQEAPSLTETNPDGHYSDTIEGITYKALAKQKVDRFQSMAEFRAELNEAFAEERARHAEAAAAEMALDSVSGMAPVSTLPPKSASQTTDRRFLAIAVVASLLMGAGALHYANVSKTSSIKTTKKKKGAKRKILVTDDPVDLQKAFFVDLSSTKKENKDLKKLKNRKSITDLDLVASDITDSGIDDILDLPIRVLRMDATKVTDVALEKLSRLSTLQVLTVGNNPYITADGIQKLGVLPRLRIVSFTETNLSDKDMRKIATIKSLEELTLATMRNLHGDGLIDLKALPSLRYLKVANDKLSDQGLKNIAQLTNLQELDLRLCRLDDKRIELITGMTNLRTLNLMQNELTDAGVLKLRKLQNLRELNLQKCPKVTKNGIIRLSAQLPYCNILHEGNQEFF